MENNQIKIIDGPCPLRQSKTVMSARQITEIFELTFYDGAIFSGKIKIQVGREVTVHIRFDSVAFFLTANQ